MRTRQCIFAILLLSLFLANSTLAQFADNIYKIPKTKIAPVIDGKEDAVWKTLNWNMQRIYNVGDPPTSTSAADSGQGLTGMSKAMWDVNNLYILFYTVDDVVVDIPANPTWNQDGIEIFIDGDNSKIKDGVAPDPGSGLAPGDLMFIIPHWLKGKEVGHLGTVFGTTFDTTGIQFKIRDVLDTEGFPGWMTEIKIPLANLGIDGASAVNQKIGWELQQDECDHASVGRQSMSKWWSSSNNSWTDASIWGTAVLSDRVVDTVFEMSKLPASAGITVDGIMDPMYRQANAVTTNLFRVGDPPTAETVDTDPMFGGFITAYPVYDDNNLYIFCDVVDQIITDIPSNPSWNQDGIEIFIDGANDKTPETSLKAAQYMFIIPHWLKGHEAGHLGTVLGTAIDTTGIQFKITDHGARGNDGVLTEEGSGYNLEVKIPLAALGINGSSAGAKLGFELQLDNSSDAAVGRQGMEKWWSSSNNSWANAAIWGTAKLGGSIQPLNYPPSGPLNLTAQAANTKVTLKWNKNTETDFLRYRIYRGTSPNPTTKVDSSSNSPLDTIKVITGLTNGTMYYFRVTAVDIAGLESGFSNEVNVTPANTIVTVDGIKDSYWDTVTGKIDIGAPQLIWGAVSSPDDASGTLYLAYDQNYLCGYFEAKDNTIGSKNSTWYENDAFDIQMDLNPSTTIPVPPNSWEEPNSRDIVTIPFTAESGFSGSASGTTNTIVSRRLTGMGYAIEFAVPFSEIRNNNTSPAETLVPDVGTEIGAAIEMIDQDLQTTREAQFVYGHSPVDTNFWKDVKQLGHMRFLANHQIEISTENIAVPVPHIDVTFRVNTKYVVPPISANDTVGIRGIFSPLTWTGSRRMTLSDGDSIYSTTVSFPRTLLHDTLQYKFYIGRQNGAFKWEDSVGVGDPPYYNRTVVFSDASMNLPVVNFNNINYLLPPTIMDLRNYIAVAKVYSATGTNWTTKLLDYSPTYGGWSEVTGYGRFEQEVFSSGGITKNTIDAPTASSNGDAATVAEYIVNNPNRVELYFGLKDGRQTTLANVRFVIQVKDGLIYTTILDSILANVSGWKYFQGNLTAWSKKTITLRLITDPNGPTYEDWAEWAQPIVYLNDTASVTVTMPLQTNWNLVSWNIDTDVDSTVTVLGGVLPKVRVALGFDGGGLTYDPSIPAQFNTLKIMDHLHGYWLKMNDTSILVLQGIMANPQTPIGLTTGYNLVSYLPVKSDSIQHALSSVMNQITVVLGYNDGGLTYDPSIPPQFNTLQILSPGYGYWIKSKSNSTLIYPSSSVIPGMQPTAGVYAQVQTTNVKPTNQWVSLWGEHVMISGKVVPKGTKITIKSEHGIVCGEGEVWSDGKFGLIPIYIDDATTKEVEGVQEGEGYTVTIGEYQIPKVTSWKEFGEVKNLAEAATGVKELETLPTEYALEQNYPNPFNPTTTIQYQLPQSGRVVLKIYNAIGMEVETLEEGYKDAGYYTVNWNAKNLASGVYFYRLQVANFLSIKKMVLIK